MLSRVAENIYWMARYVERAENMARLVNVNAFLLLDLPKKVRFGWTPLVEITGSQKLYKQLYSDQTERSVVRFLIGDENNPGSLLSSARQARENVRTIRDVVPRETAEQINELYLFARSGLARGLAHAGRFEYLKAVILRCQTITGLLAGTMVHDAGYDFLRMGRNLERADMTTRIIDVRSANLLPDVSVDLRPFENVQWMSVLKSLSGYQAYRRVMQVNVRRPDVLRFLFQEKIFPRAFFHTMGEVESCLQSLPRRDEPLKAVHALQKVVTDRDPESLTQADLHGFIDKLQLGLIDLHNRIREAYFLFEDSAAKPRVRAKDA